MPLYSPVFMRIYSENIMKVNKENLNQATVTILKFFKSLLSFIRVKNTKRVKCWIKFTDAPLGRAYREISSLPLPVPISMPLVQFPFIPLISFSYIFVSFNWKQKENMPLWILDIVRTKKITFPGNPKAKSPRSS